MIPQDAFEQTLMGFLDPVRRYLEDASVTEIMINGPAQVYIERAGRLEITGAEFSSAEAVMRALRNAAQFVGKQLDEMNPMLEARLPDGSRIHAVIPPAAPLGPYVSIRRFTQETFTVGRLIELGTVTSDAAEALRVIVQGKLNLLIGGGTGSGKTSLLNMVSNFIPGTDRTAVIEDSKEVQIQRPHVVYLETRPPNPEGLGGVTIRDLFRTSLRMRPDRIVVGELRGGEALDIIQAMVSGHGGCLGTLHATYPRDTLTRLETMAMMSDVDVPLAALRLQIASGVNVIVQIARVQDGTRKVTHISEVRGYDASSGTYRVVDLFLRHFDGMTEDGGVVSHLEPTGALPDFLPLLRHRGLDLPRAQYVAADRGKAR